MNKAKQFTTQQFDEKIVSAKIQVKTIARTARNVKWQCAPL